MAPNRSQSPETRQALMAQDIDAIKRELTDIKQMMSLNYVPMHELQMLKIDMKQFDELLSRYDKRFNDMLDHNEKRFNELVTYGKTSYVTQDQYWPVKTTVFGIWTFVGTAALGLVGAAVGLMLRG